MSFYYPLPARWQCLYISCDAANIRTCSKITKEKPRIFYGAVKKYHWIDLLA